MAWIHSYSAVAARYVMAALMGYHLIDEIMHHGEEKVRGKYNGWAAIIAVLFEAGLLNAGGFWG